MTKIGIVTIVDYNNYGNRLQNYALSTTLKKLCPNARIVTFKNDARLNDNKGIIKNLEMILKHFYTDVKIGLYMTSERGKRFSEFNKLLDMSESISIYNKNKKCDKYVVGSDQVWKPTYRRLSSIDLLTFEKNSRKKIAYAASIGIDEIDDVAKNKIKKHLTKDDFAFISLREESGKRLVEDITGRDDIVHVLDPTLLLSFEEWEKIEKSPSFEIPEKYILTYFLGQNTYKKDILQLANENTLEVINLNDKTSSDYYNVGPREYLYLFHHATAIFTDSFHAIVFSLIYDKPFYVLDRKQTGMNNMNSRIDSFLKTFGLEDRHVKSVLQKNFLEKDYCKVYEILEKERKKSLDFLINSLK